MAIDVTDWTVTRADGNIRYTGGDHGSSPTYATSIEFHRFLQDIQDDESYTVASGDQADIVDTEASDRLGIDNIIQLKGIYNIDAASAEHIYDGSILQGTGPTEEIWDAIVNFGNADVQIQLIQDGAIITDDWWNEAGAGLNPDATNGISHRFLVKVREFGVDIDQRRILGTSREFNNTYSEFPINGTSRGNNVLAISDADDLNNDTAAGTVSGWTGITNTEGLRLLDINNDTTDEEYFTEWDADIPATRTINEFYERMKWLTRSGSASTINGLNGELFRGITHSLNYDNETGTAATTNDELAYGTNLIYDTETLGPFTIGEAIHEDTATPVWKGRVLAIDDDGTAGSLVVDVESGTITTGDNFTGQSSGAKANTNGTPTAVTTGGVFRIFAYDDDGTTGNIYGQLMKGRAPVTDDRMFFGGATADIARYVDAHTTVTERPVSKPWCGVSTGTALIGSYGFGLLPADGSDTDSFTDLSGATITPPNNVTFTLNGLISGDRVLVTNNDAGGIDQDQMAIAILVDSATATTIDVGIGNIPIDTPATGTIRVQRNSGLITRHPYSAIDSGFQFFTITSAAFDTDNASVSNDCFVSYLDLAATGTSENFSTVYDIGLGDRTLFARVRDGGGTPIKTAETTGVLGTGGGSATVNRIDDD
jgi:hypothetical protein